MPIGTQVKTVVARGSRGCRQITAPLIAAFAVARLRNSKLTDDALDDTAEAFKKKGNPRPDGIGQYIRHLREAKKLSARNHLVRLETMARVLATLDRYITSGGMALFPTSLQFIVSTNEHIRDIRDLFGKF